MFFLISGVGPAERDWSPVHYSNLQRAGPRGIFVYCRDCVGYGPGGGVTGALAALRAMPKRADFVAVGYELFDATRAALIDGTLSMLISHPIERFGRETISTLLKAKAMGNDGGAYRVTLPFDVYTPESV